MSKYLISEGLFDDLQDLQDDLTEGVLSKAQAAKKLKVILDEVTELDVWHEAGILFDNDGEPVKKSIVAGYFCK